SRAPSKIDQHTPPNGSLPSPPSASAAGGTKSASWMISLRTVLRHDWSALFGRSPAPPTP
ncbi:MAG TPA: hypothetical protein VGF33_12100, partial [Caulobacteraceae bacterium]